MGGASRRGREGGRGKPSRADLAGADTLDGDEDAADLCRLVEAEVDKAADQRTQVVAGAPQQAQVHGQADGPPRPANRR